MVVLAASIVSKTGKALVSRQYFEMTRIRIEGLLAAFPKLVGSGKQHTYVETENVRYVYQPLEVRRPAVRKARRTLGEVQRSEPLRAARRACFCCSSPTSRATFWRTWTRCACSPRWCRSTAGCVSVHARARLQPPTRAPQVVDEETVCKTAFELIFAFDEARQRCPASRWRAR